MEIWSVHDHEDESSLECEQNGELMQLWMDSIQSKMCLAPVRHVKFNSDNFEYTDGDGCVIYVQDLTHMAPPRTRGEVRGERVQKAVMLSNMGLPEQNGLHIRRWRRVVVVLYRCCRIC